MSVPFYTPALPNAKQRFALVGDYRMVESATPGVRVQVQRRSIRGRWELHATFNSVEQAVEWATSTTVWNHAKTRTNWTPAPGVPCWEEGGQMDPLCCDRHRLNPICTDGRNRWVRCASCGYVLRLYPCRLFAK